VPTKVPPKNSFGGYFFYPQTDKLSTHIVEPHATILYMNPLDSSTEEQMPSVRKPHYFLTLLAWVLVTALVISAYLYHAGYFIYKPSTSPIPSGISTSTTGGFLFLNLAAQNGPLRLYMYDIAHKSLALSNIQSFTPSASMNGRFFVGIDSGTNANSASIAQYDSTQATMSLFADGIAGFPRLPQVSPDDTSVIFNTLRSGTASSSFPVPSSWDISLVSKGGIAHPIVRGLYPHWSPDGSSMLYVSDDGLHTYTFKGNTDTVVYKMQPGITTVSMTLDVSKDGTRLVWTNPLQNELMIGHIISWSPFSARVEKIIPISAFSPILSPDGSQVVFQQTEVSTTTHLLVSAHLMLLDINTEDLSNLMDLNSYDQSRLFISDWVTHL